MRCILILIMAAFLTISCHDEGDPPEPDTLTQGLVAFYPFSGDANDQATNHFNGIVHEAQLTTDRKGVANAAYSFNGITSYIKVPHDGALNLDSDFTISLWVEISSTQEAEGGINDILRKWNGNAEGYPYAISYLNPLADDSKEDRVSYARYDGQACADVLETLSPTIANDTFVHIALLKQGGAIRTYLNGDLIAEVTDPVRCSTGNTADLTIGCRGNLVRFFKGKIDDIRLYNRPLTDAEIDKLAAE